MPSECSVFIGVLKLHKSLLHYQLYPGICLALKNALERYVEAILLYGIVICVEMLIVCRKFR